VVHKAELLSRLGALLEGEHGFSRVHPDASDPFARAALEALAGLPAYELVESGYLRSLLLVACASGERTSGAELARRAELLFRRARVLGERLDSPVTALQLALYERKVTAEERDFVIGHARRVPLFGFGKTRVATWVFALDEPALHARRYRGWPPELSSEELRKLLVSRAAS
jgi:hypothetical protein